VELGHIRLPHNPYPFFFESLILRDEEMPGKGNYPPLHTSVPKFDRFPTIIWNEPAVGVRKAINF